MKATTMLDKLGVEGWEQTALLEPKTHSTEIETNPTSEAAFNSAEVELTAKEDMDFLAALAMPLVFTFFFPPVFKAVWQWLRSYAHLAGKFPQLALGLPRGFGKSTVIKLFCLYVILFTKRSFILIIAETEGKAKAIVADICDMLDEPNIKRIFGDWRVGLEKDTQDTKKFGFRGRNIIIKAAGSGTGIRGINEKHRRPDIMIFDDIQSREESESPVISDALMTWLLSTAMKAKSPTGCMFLFIANMYPTKGSLLRKLKYNKTWTKFICGGILDNGESLWEELQPISQLLQEFENDLEAGHPEVFYSEVLNDENASAHNLLDLSKVPEYPFAPGDPAAGKFIIIDPSNDKWNSDEVSIGYFEVHDIKPCMMKLISEVLSPGETIRKSLELAMQTGTRCIVIEGNAYQYTLKYWFDFIMEQTGITGIECVDIYSGSFSKTSRILKMLRAYGAGEIYTHPDVRSDVHLQISQFNPMKNNNTDGVLDLLTYAPRVMEQYGDYILSVVEIDSQEFNSIKVLEHNSPF